MFRFFYVVCRGQFSKISNGHCLNTKPNGQFRKTDNPCEFFMEKDAQKEREEQMKYATEWLSIIAERLSELTQILKDE